MGKAGGEAASDGDAGAELFLEGVDFEFEAGGLLEMLLGDGSIKFTAQAGQQILLRFALTGVSGHFADVTGAFVHGLEQSVHAITEDTVAFGAAKTAGLAESGLRHAAGRAGFFLGMRLHTLAVAKAQEHVRQREAGGVGDAFFLGAVLAKIDFLHVPLHDLGQENGGCVLIANIALHGGQKGKGGLRGRKVRKRYGCAGRGKGGF